MPGVVTQDFCGSAREDAMALWQKPSQQRTLEDWLMGFFLMFLLNQYGNGTQVESSVSPDFFEKDQQENGFSVLTSSPGTVSMPFYGT